MADEQHGAPAAGDVLHLAEALLLKARVADGQHLVDDQDLRVEMRRHGEGQAHVHAARVALHRRVQEAADLAELDDLVELALDLGPRHAEDGAVQLDVLAAGELGDGSRCPPRAGSPPCPLISTRPSVGSVMCESTLSSVLLPAPLRPMIPSTSPCLTSRSTSLSAQSSSEVCVAAPGWRMRSSGRLAACTSVSRSVRYACALAADAVHLAETDGAQGDVAHRLHHIGEHALHALEVEQAAEEQHHDHGDRDPHVAAGELLTEQRPAKAADHAGHRVQGESDAQRTGGDLV